MSPPTQRTKAKMLKEGYTFVEVVEHWNPWSRTRKDLFSFIDILCLKNNELLAVQTTSASNVSARLNKIKSIPAALMWVSSPSRRLVVHGWGKRGERGKRKVWECREVEVTEEMFGL